MMRWKCACGKITEFVVRFDTRKSEKPIPFIKCDTCQASYVIVFFPFEGSLYEDLNPPLLDFGKHRVKKR
jgi:hypothetical protein